MPCDDIQAVLSAFSACEQTPAGARIATHCMYPSFEPVYVYVSKMGDGYRVHDGGGAFESAWLHGRDRSIAVNSLMVESARYRLEVSGHSLALTVESREWLTSAILGVANASASAANHAVAHAVAAAEEALVDRIDASLLRTFGANAYRKGFVTKGRSGKEHRFDFALPFNGDFGLLIDGVAPHPTSISAKYVAFADTDGDQGHKFAVYDRALETADTALLQQVSSIVPLGSLPVGARRALAHGSSHRL
jgi:hypothetical protein